MTKTSLWAGEMDQWQRNQVHFPAPTFDLRGSDMQSCTHTLFRDKCIYLIKNEKKTLKKINLILRDQRNKSSTNLNERC